MLNTHLHYILVQKTYSKRKIFVALKFKMESLFQRGGGGDARTIIIFKRSLLVQSQLSIEYRVALLLNHEWAQDYEKGVFAS